MYIYMYINMYIYMCIYMYIYIICIYMYIHVYICIYMYHMFLQFTHICINAALLTHNYITCLNGIGHNYNIYIYIDRYGCVQACVFLLNNHKLYDFVENDSRFCARSNEAVYVWIEHH